MNIGKKTKAFIIGAIATLGIGGVTAVSVNKQNKQNEIDNQKDKETWQKINADADSIVANPQDGHFYAEKKADTVALAKLEAQKAELEAQKQKMLDEADAMYKKAIKNKDYKAMEAAIYKGAIISGEDLLKMLQDPSDQAYYIARYLIKIGVDTRAKDKYGSTAIDYASAMHSVKGETLKREIKESSKDHKKPFRPATPPEIMQIDKTLDEISENMKKAEGYTMQLDVNDGKQSLQYYINDGKETHPVKSPYLSTSDVKHLMHFGRPKYIFADKKQEQAYMLRNRLFGRSK